MYAFANSILHFAATSGLRWALDDDLLVGVEVSQWTQPVFLTGTKALNRKYCMDLFFGGYVFVCCRRFCLGAGDAIDVVLFYLYFCDLAVVVRCQWLIFFCKILLFICASFLYLATSVAEPNRKWLLKKKIECLQGDYSPPVVSIYMAQNGPCDQLHSSVLHFTKTRSRPITGIYAIASWNNWHQVSTIGLFFDFCKIKLWP